MSETTVETSGGKIDFRSMIAAEGWEQQQLVNAAVAQLFDRMVKLIEAQDAELTELAAAVTSDLRALSNRIEAVTRRLPPLDARAPIPQDWQRRGFLNAQRADNDEHSHGL